MSELSLKEIQKEWHGSARSYVIGFTGSILLTIASFSITAIGWMSGQSLIYTLMALAVTQAAIQLKYFLHLGEEAHPRWETVVFFFMLLLLLIVAIGTIWIMSDLDARMMGWMKHD
jgi:cytochrome o ubiquinol oxidase operon protein cyoD